MPRYFFFGLFALLAAVGMACAGPTPVPTPTTGPEPGVAPTATTTSRPPSEPTATPTTIPKPSPVPTPTATATIAGIAGDDGNDPVVDPGTSVGERIPTIEIVKVWSDQFPEVVANYLPDGAGVDRFGYPHDYILAGVRYDAATSDDRAFAKAEFRITPDTPEARQMLLVRLARVSFLGFGSSWVPIGTGSIADDVASMSVGHSIFSPSVEFNIGDLAIVAGFDTDGDGKLSEAEVTTVPPPPYRFTFVSRLVYAASFSTTSALDSLGGSYMIGRLEALYGGPGVAPPGLPLPELQHAPLFLTNFLLGTPIPGAARENAELRAADPSCLDAVTCLNHNVGAKFDARGIAVVDRWVFQADSAVAHDIRRSINWIEKLNEILELERPSIQRFLSDPNPDGSSSPSDRYVFSQEVHEELHFVPNKLSVVANLRTSPDPDLFLTFGRGKLDLTITGTVQREGGKLLSMKIEGTLEDLYDWNLDVDFIPSRVQAGYGTLGNSGAVFLSRVHLDCEYHDPGFYFGDVASSVTPWSGCSVVAPVSLAKRTELRGATSFSDWFVRLGGRPEGPPGALSSIMEDVVQGRTEESAIGFSLPAQISGLLVAGSGVLAYERDNVTTAHRPGDPFIYGRQGEQWALGYRRRPLMVVAVDPAAVARSDTATLVLGGVSASAYEWSSPQGVRGFTGLDTGWTSVGSEQSYEVAIYAAPVPGRDYQNCSLPSGDLFDDGVPVGTFQTNTIPSIGPLRVELDMEALQQVSAFAGGCFAFIVRGFDDLPSLAQATSSREEEQIGEVLRCPFGGAPFGAYDCTTIDAKKWLGRAKLLTISTDKKDIRIFEEQDRSYSSPEQDFLVLERGDPELALGRLEAFRGLVESP